MNLEFQFLSIPYMEYIFFVVHGLCPAYSITPPPTCAYPGLVHSTWPLASILLNPSKNTFHFLTDYFIFSRWSNLTTYSKSLQHRKLNLSSKFYTQLLPWVMSRYTLGCQKVITSLPNYDDNKSYCHDVNVAMSIIL